MTAINTSIEGIKETASPPAPGVYVEDWIQDLFFCHFEVTELQKGTNATTWSGK